MEINLVVLDDMPRLDALDRKRAICLTFCESGKDPDAVVFLCDFVYKFMLIADGTLIVAPITDHRLVLGAYHVREKSVEEAIQILKPLHGSESWNSAIYRELDRLRPIAAGNITHDGKIIQWHSEGFHLKTPEILKQSITDIIAAMFERGPVLKGEKSKH